MAIITSTISPVRVSVGVMCDWLDTETFPWFAPLLDASADYARHGGCRFRSSSFDGLEYSATGDAGSATVPVVETKKEHDAVLRLAAKLRASPAVRDFSGRLKVGEPQLVGELNRAFELTNSETIRNTMIGVCKQHGMFPPSPPPNIQDEDCYYEDSSASVHEITQRLYNSEVMRLCETSQGVALSARRAKTAAYIVEFAEQVGCELPHVPEDRLACINEFQQRAETAWGDAGEATSVITVDVGTAVGELYGKVGSWWCDNRETVLWTAGAVVAGAVAIAGASRGAANRQSQRAYPARGWVRARDVNINKRETAIQCARC